MHIFLKALFAGLVCVYTVNAQTPDAARTKEAITLRSADDSLALVYKRVLEEYASQPKFIKQLKKSQALWKKMREADLLMRFPRKDDNPNYYGSVFSDCYSTLAKAYTQKRIAFLNQWLEGIPEGDVCAGSIRKKDE